MQIVHNKIIALIFTLFLRFFGELIHGITTRDELLTVLEGYYPYFSFAG
jgi:hypothetical protein